MFVQFTFAALIAAACADHEVEIPSRIFDAHGAIICTTTDRWDNNCYPRLGTTHVFWVQGGCIPRQKESAYRELETVAIASAIGQYERSLAMQPTDCMRRYQRLPRNSRAIWDGFNCLRTNELSQLVERRRRLLGRTDHPIRWLLIGGVVDPDKISVDIPQVGFDGTHRERVWNYQTAFLSACFEQQRRPKPESQELFRIMVEVAKLDWSAADPVRRERLKREWEARCPRNAVEDSGLQDLRMILDPENRRIHWECGLYTRILRIGWCGRVYELSARDSQVLGNRDQETDVTAEVVIPQALPSWSAVVKPPWPWIPLVGTTTTVQR